MAARACRPTENGGLMNKRVVRRLLETFFRRWWLYLVPVVLFTGVGVMMGFDGQNGYESAGVVDVSKGTLLSQLTSIRGENFGYETPATATAKTMNSLMGTDQFISAVAKSAGVTDALERGELTDLAMRRSISITPDGDTLVKVVATTDNPELSSRLAKATIDSFIEYNVNDEVSESKAAESFFNTQLQTYSDSLNSAQTALAEYAANHPGGPEGDRPLAEQIEIQRLKASADQAQTQYTAAEQKSDEARLATAQARADATQRIRLIDEPKVGLASAGGLRNALFTTAIFMIAGALLSFAAVVLGTVIDRSLRSSDDAEQLLGLTVLAAVPTEGDLNDSRRSVHRRRRGRADASEREDGPARPAERATVAVASGPRMTKSARRPEALPSAKSASIPPTSRSESSGR
jgi:uncharacterized protein involved in exopolysaccharide biosynthesis